MQSFNGARVGVVLLGVAGLATTVLCPWWRYRFHEDLAAEVLAQEATDGGYAFLLERSGGLDLETHVGMINLWDIRVYEVAEWLPFNVIQLLGVAAFFALGLLWARQFDLPGKTVPTSSGACPPIPPQSAET